MRKSQYSYLRLVEIHQRIVDCKNIAKYQSLNERLNEFAKILIWGQKNNSDYLDYFSEVKFLDLMFEIFSTAKEKQPIIAIISFINIMLTNITKQQSINYILSHTTIMNIQTAKFININNEVAEYYINLLKCFSKKMTDKSIYLFFNKRHPCFPLLTQSIRFYNHPEGLIRTTCNNIVLTVCKLSTLIPKISEFMSGFPFVIYYLNQCALTKSHWFNINKIIESQQPKASEQAKILQLTQDNEESLEYLNDFINFGTVNIKNCIINAFTKQCLTPLIISLASSQRQYFGIKIALYCFTTMLKIFTNKELVQLIILSLFGRYYPRLLTSKFANCKEKCNQKYEEWSFKGFWDSYDQLIHKYCGKYFGQLVNKNQIEGLLGSKKYIFEKQIKKIEEIFEVNIFSNEIQSSKKYSSMVVEELKKDLKIQRFNLNNYDQNPIRDAILSFLSSKDDTLVVTTTILINYVVRSKVSNEIIDFCGLNINPVEKDFRSIITIELILNNCFNILSVDPPVFRICTYFYVSELIRNLSCIYKNKQFQMPFQIIKKIKNAMKNNVGRINPYLYSGKDGVKVVTTLNEIEQINMLDYPQTLKVYGLIPQDNFKKGKKTTQNPLFYEFPETYDQQIARDLWLYVIVRDLLFFIFQQNYKKNQKQEKQTQIQKIKQFQQNKKDLISAQVSEDDEKVHDCKILFLADSMIIQHNNVIQYDCCYIKTITIADNSDPRKIIISSNKNTLSVILATAIKSYEFRSQFEKRKKIKIKRQLEQIIKDIENIINKFI